MELRLLNATLLSLLFYVCSHSTACFPPDREALRQLAFAFTQNNSKSLQLLGWEGDKYSCCSWHGVVCKSATTTTNHSASRISGARISELLLSNQYVAMEDGAISKAICSLSALSTLDLSHNFLKGSIPTCLAHNLTNLRRLDLSYNFLNGLGLHPYSWTLPQLTYLDLSWNDFNNSIPPLQTPGLQYLDLSHNRFTSGISNLFTSPVLQLQRLDLSFNHLNGPILPDASTLPQLTYLDLSVNDFNISILPFQTPRLQYLDLSSNRFTSAIGIFSNLFSSPLLQLQHLKLSYCKTLSGEIPVTAIISHFPQLHTLLLDTTSLTVEGRQISELLCGLKSLEVFSMNGLEENEINSFRGSNSMGEMPHPPSCRSPSLNLTILHLSYNQLGGPFPAWLSLFSNLQELSLSGNNFYSSAIPPEWQNLTRLTVLQLSGPASTLHPKPFLLPQHMQNWLFRLPLQTLTLSSLGLANQHIPCYQLSLLNATLQSLDFSNNLLTSSHALQCLAHNNFTTLSSLDLSQNALAFNLGLAIPPSFITELNLISCELQGELTDQFFGMLRSIIMISLAHNSFSGSLPLGIRVLEQTISLDLSYNNLTGPIPPSLGNMRVLNFLSLENNHLEGEVPRELGKLTDLNNLFLGNNKLTKWLPTNNESTPLAILDLSYNKLEGDLETFCGHGLLSSLVVLLLGHNRLRGTIPAALNGTTTPYLSIIQLCDNQLTGTIPHTLSKLFTSAGNNILQFSVIIGTSIRLVVKNLELSYDSRSFQFAYLDLSNNKLNGSIPESLGDSLSRLMYLNLSRNQFTGNIPSSLSKLSLLESLDLSYNRLQGSIPPSLSQLTKLAVFNVSFNEELSGPIPANSPQLQQATSYIGDQNVCGEPYLQRCSDILLGAGVAPPHAQEDHQSESFVMKWIDKWIAVPGFFLGMVLGFLGALWVLRLTHFV